MLMISNNTPLITFLYSNEANKNFEITKKSKKKHVFKFLIVMKGDFNIKGYISSRKF